MGYISCGKLNKKYIYIVVSVVFLVLKDIAFGNNYNNSFKPLFHNRDLDQELNQTTQNQTEKFTEHYLINNIFSYSFTSILSFILYKIERKNLEWNSLKEKENEENSSLPTIKYIHNVSNNAYLSNNALLLFLIIILLWIIDENLIQFFSFSKDLDFWMFEIIITAYMISIMYKKKIYLPLWKK